jgi:hypothetical protein
LKRLFFMKKSIFWMWLAVAAGVICSLTLSAGYAADTNAAPVDAAAVQPVLTGPAPAVTPSAAVSAPAKLPYGVDDVLKLSRAQVSEDITLNYIQNSGTIYNLGPNDIVYLRSQGVSDNVINAMLGQRQRVTQMAAQTPAPAAPAVAAQDTSGAAAPAYQQVAPTYVTPPTDTQTAPASSVYVIPYPPAQYAYYGYARPYGYYGYYGYPYPYYYGCYGPVVSYGYRYGGYRYYGGHWGGGHWGGHHH